MIILALAAASSVPNLPEWMAGCWATSAGQRWTEECWSTPRGGMMIGYSRSGTGDELREWESMQLVLKDKSDDRAVVRLAFWASPSGANRTMFAWSPSRIKGLTFYNVENDYPQRIRYWREGADLMAEIAMQDGSKPRRWRYKRVKP